MSELTEFLKARIEEDHATAEQAASAAASVTDGASVDRWPGKLTAGPRGYGTVEATGQRVLDECDAKWRIVTHLGLDANEPGPANPSSSDLGQAAVTTLQLLALPYAGHPDYDKAWRP